MTPDPDVPQTGGVYITDHHHQPKMLGRWRSTYCEICDYPSRCHVSWGLYLSEILGGVAMDYVTPLPVNPPHSPAAPGKEHL